MFKRFFDGMLFGAGFAISYFVVWWLWGAVLSSSDTHVGKPVTPQSSSAHRQAEVMSEKTQETPFHELSIDERIKRSSAIALAEYIEGDDGQLKAVINEFLKTEPGTTIYYDVGDEFEHASYYPEPNTRYGDGVIIFFADTPARFRMSVTYSGDRISALGDMPMRLFREKCATL